MATSGKLAVAACIANVICTKGTRHGRLRPFGDQLKWQTVPGRRHGDPESSSELVNRPLSSLTTSNVPPLRPPSGPPLSGVSLCPHVYPAPAAAAAAVTVTVTVVADDSFVRQPDGNRIFPPQNKPPACPSVHTRTAAAAAARTVSVSLFTWVYTCAHAHVPYRVYKVNCILYLPLFFFFYFFVSAFTATIG